MPGPQPENNYNPNSSVAPTTNAPQDTINIRANPNQFGAQIGSALEGGGKQLEQTSDQLSNYIYQKAVLSGDMAANAGSNQLAQTFASTEDEFKRNYRGMNAVNQLHPVLNSMQQQMNDQAAQILKSHGPLAQEAYLRDSRSFYNNSVLRLGNYVDGEAITEADKQWQGKFASYRNQASLSADNTAIVQGMLDKTVSDTLIYENQFKGTTDPNTIHAAVSQNVGQLLNESILSTAYTGDTALEQKQALDKAQVLYDQYKDKTIPGEAATPYLDAQQRDQIQSRLTQREWQLSGRLDRENAKGLSNTVLSDAHGLYIQDLQNMPQQVGHYSSGQVFNALIPQESSGNPNAVNARTGASGLTQITPGLFQQYAKSGQNFNNQADRTEVSNRVMDKYLSQYNNDPGRAMVAWFSGEGNVAPAGSSVPWTTDKSDGNMTTSQYVEKGLARLNGSGGYQRFSDYAEAHFSDLMDHSKTLAASQFPDRPDLQQTAVSNAQTNLYNIIRTQKIQDKTDSDNIYSYISGNNQYKVPITNVKELETAPESIKETWERMKTVHGSEAFNLENKLIAANSHGDAIGLGSKFWDYYSQTMTGKVNDYNSLLSEVGAGKDAVLTNTGLKTLYPLLQRANTSEGQAFNSAEMKFFNQLRPSVTSTGVSPGAHDGQGDDKFNQFMALTIPKIEAEKQAGKTAEQMFDPKSPDYVGGAVSKFQPDFNERMKTLQKNALAQAAMHQTVQYNSPNDLIAARKVNKITDDQFRAIGKQHPDWWAKPTETLPSVPRAQF